MVGNSMKPYVDDFLSEHWNLELHFWEAHSVCTPQEWCGLQGISIFSKNIQHKTWKFILTKEYEGGKNMNKETVAPKHLMCIEVAVL